MPRPYSTDRRERALAAYEAGEGSQAMVARRYRVGERTLSGRLKAAREGRRSPKPRARGPQAARPRAPSRAPAGRPRWAARGRCWPSSSPNRTTPRWPNAPSGWRNARACGAASPPSVGR
jgi:transposase-like protein